MILLLQSSSTKRDGKNVSPVHLAAQSAFNSAPNRPPTVIDLFLIRFSAWRHPACRSVIRVEGRENATFGPSSQIWLTPYPEASPIRPS